MFCLKLLSGVVLSRQREGQYVYAYLQDGDAAERCTAGGAGTFLKYAVDRFPGSFYCPLQKTEREIA